MEGPRWKGRVHTWKSAHPTVQAQPSGDPHSWRWPDTIQLVKAKCSLRPWGQHFYTVEAPLTRQLTLCHKASEENAEEWLPAACPPA